MVQSLDAGIPNLEDFPHPIQLTWIPTTQNPPPIQNQVNPRYLNQNSPSDSLLFNYFKKNEKEKNSADATSSKCK